MVHTTLKKRQKSFKKMGKKIIWSKNALEQLEDIHFYIFFESKSIHIADKIVTTILTVLKF